MKKVYSEEEIQLYSKNPKVSSITKNRLTLTLEFRKELYRAWLVNPTTFTVKRILYENGFDVNTIGNRYCSNIVLNFKRNGEPKYSKPDDYGVIQSEADALLIGLGENPLQVEAPPLDKLRIRAGKKKLVDTGKFVALRNGVWFSADYAEELYNTFPMKSIRQSIEEDGFDIKVVGSYNVRKLGAIFETAMETETHELFARKKPLDADEISGLKINPMVKKVSQEWIELSAAFYNAAAVMKEMPLNQILDVFFVDHTRLTAHEKHTVKTKLDRIRPEDSLKFVSKGTDIELKILQRRESALLKLVERNYELIAVSVPFLSGRAKKILCLWIESLPKDPAHVYKKKTLIRKLGFTSSVYYSYVKEPDYGLGEERKIKADMADAEIIKKVMDYRGFRKGARMIFMLMPRIMNRVMGIKRIRRLMKLYNLNSGIREPNVMRRAARENLEETVRPNLLSRKFRLYRPNEVRVTDVTYLDYGNDQRAYGSALMDPVSSLLIAFVVSENNDISLALETLYEADMHPCEDGGIFHSDQGVLYRAKQFQQEILDRGMLQSMSKRGNCWDNASQESFFGHFKDECEYQSCASIEELRELVGEYKDYYNNERGMWNREKMTPAEYEAYLLSLDDSEFRLYLAREEEKYNEMKERAADLAKKRYGTLGV